MEQISRPLVPTVIGVFLIVLLAIIYSTNQKFLSASVFPYVNSVPLCGLLFGKEIIPPPKWTFLPESRIYYRDACYTKRLEIVQDWKDCERKFSQRDIDWYLPEYETEEETIGHCVAQISMDVNLCTKLSDQKQQNYCLVWRDRSDPPPTIIPTPTGTYAPY